MSLLEYKFVPVSSRVFLTVATFVIGAGGAAMLVWGLLSNSSAHNLSSQESIQGSFEESIKTSQKIYKKPESTQNSPPSPNRLTIRVKNGEGIMDTLLRADIPRQEAHNIIQAVGEHLHLRKIPAGQPLDLTYPPVASPLAVGETVPLESLTIEMGGGKFLRVVRSQNSWSATVRARALEERDNFTSNRIESSLFVAAQDAGLPLSVISEFIKIYSHVVDFQREIRKNDSFEVFYSHEYDRDGKPAHHEPELLYLSLTVQGKALRLWRHEDPQTGIIDYFDEGGKSTKRLLMRTPIDGARLSSRFGMRKHPILGYSRMHRGLDFAAPTGTPIYASGNGVVTRIGRNNGYGEMIRLRHANGYETLYAHLSRYAKGLKKGSRVEQGETIGYVGSTGLSTGPHLHYEVHLQGKSLNPLTLDLPLGRVLEDFELTAFHKTLEGLETRMGKVIAYQ